MQISTKKRSQQNSQTLLTPKSGKKGSTATKGKGVKHRKISQGQKNSSKKEQSSQSSRSEISGLELFFCKKEDEPSSLKPSWREELKEN